ncbi:phospholipid-binding lipoprotein [Candidatus Photodesmus blepharus]|uniref:Phospholipid-binding lipoprotein n=1 Tax=Candidatus Photodesmus blepharonis TaxID=1179155 RepID=A0A084CMY1_9GAMM|nr:MlaA family lipoprotein [Candidatus Photodesmus blepharus]KEY91160.1 phospholipid-binding lipoprotein [Candidatus Photodesmus blepharus]
MIRALVISLFITSALGCAVVPKSKVVTNKDDPLEKVNRVMWIVNYDYLDPYLLRPISLAYVEYIPRFIRSGISNFLGNLDQPSSAINTLIAGNNAKSLAHLSRFLVNSTFGLLGFIDVASEIGIVRHTNKAFSDVAGYYGVKDGLYTVLPIYGPWTIRELVNVTDVLYPPLSYLNIYLSFGKWILEAMESRASLISLELQLKDSPDPYALTREIYLQSRSFKAGIEVDRDLYENEEYFDEYFNE